MMIWTKVSDETLVPLNLTNNKNYERQDFADVLRHRQMDEGN